MATTLHPDKLEKLRELLGTATGAKNPGQRQAASAQKPQPTASQAATIANPQATELDEPLRLYAMSTNLRRRYFPHVKN